MNKNTFLVSDRAIPIPWVVFVLGCIFYISNLDFASVGDVIYYANIIDTLRFDQLTLHQAYYLIGFLCKFLFGWLFGLTTDESLVLMSAFFGAAALSTSYLLLKSYLESKYEALLGVLILLLCHRFYINSITAEIYIVQTFFIWTSYLLFDKKRFYLAGISFAFAMWTSPLTIAFGLFFPVAAYLRGFGIQSIMRLAVPVIIIYVPFLFFYYEELLWGIRGVINEDGSRQIDLVAGIYDVFRYQIKHYTFLNLLFIPAIFAFRREKRLLWISIALVLPNLYVVSQLLDEESVFILTLDVFFTFWFIIGWRVLRERSLEWVAITLLSAHFIVFIISQVPFFSNSNKTYGDEFKTISQVMRSSDNPILFADWSRRMSLIYYSRNSAVYPLEDGYWYEVTFDIDELNEVPAEPESFARYEAVFVLESYSPSLQAKLFLDDDTLKERYERTSERRRIERFLDVQCQPVHSGILVLYRCR